MAYQHLRPGNKDILIVPGRHERRTLRPQSPVPPSAEQINRVLLARYLARRERLSHEWSSPEVDHQLQLLRKKILAVADTPDLISKVLDQQDAQYRDGSARLRRALRDKRKRPLTPGKKHKKGANHAKSKCPTGGSWQAERGKVGSSGYGISKSAARRAKRHEAEKKRWRRKRRIDIAERCQTLQRFAGSLAADFSKPDFKTSTAFAFIQKLDDMKRRVADLRPRLSLVGESSLLEGPVATVQVIGRAAGMLHPAARESISFSLRILAAQLGILSEMNRRASCASPMF